MAVERRRLSDTEITDLVTRLAAFRPPAGPDEIGPFVESLGWTILSTRRRIITLDTGFGTRTGDVKLDFHGGLRAVHGAICTPVIGQDAASRRPLQDAFARAVAVTAEVLGEPTLRIPGKSAEVRWGGPETTISVKILSTRVHLYLMTNAYVRDLDASDPADQR